MKQNTKANGVVNFADTSAQDNTQPKSEPVKSNKQEIIDPEDKRNKRNTIIK
ncbi:hypothetical protein FACS1894166_06570 [Bacilli bacterium]|nr:hypothetical protein FACS1894166_06570 [Bacilli bacterium]